MILVDTSIWVGHLRSLVPELTALIKADQVVMHPFIIGELAAGGLPRRAQTLDDLHAFSTIAVASHSDVLAMVEFHRLYGIGLSWIDLHLLAAARIARVQLWTADTRLAAAAKSSGIAY